MLNGPFTRMQPQINSILFDVLGYEGEYSGGIAVNSQLAQVAARRTQSAQLN